MSAQRDVDRIVRSWIQEEDYDSADRVLEIVLSRLDTTPQRRPLWPTRRFAHVNKLAQAAIAAAAVLVVAVIGYNLLPSSGGAGGQPSPTPTAVPSPSPSPSPAETAGSGSVTITPFDQDGFGMCPTEVSSDCTEDPLDDSMAFAVALPEVWEVLDGIAIAPEEEGTNPPGGATLLITRGNWLYSDPCQPNDEVSPDIEVGPTVEDFATALDSHPLLDVTTPVDVTLAGHSGLYLELQVPADISECFRYRPIDQTIYAQGPSHRWRYWILDVDGIRAVIQAYDYPETSTQRRTELQAIVDSIRITP